MSEAMSGDFYKAPDDSEYDELPAELAEPVTEFEPVSFLQVIEKELDYRHLASMAQSSDSGVKLLANILAQTGQIEPIESIDKYKSQFSANQSRLDSLEAKESSTQLRPEEAGEKKFLMKEANNTLNAGWVTWIDVEDRISHAKAYYDNVFVNPETRVRNINMIQDLYDDTQQYDNSGLIAVIKELRKFLRQDAQIGGKPPSRTVEYNVAETEILVRLLILQETGQLSFD